MSLKEISELRLTGYKPVSVILHFGQQNEHCEEMAPWIVAVKPNMPLRVDLRPILECQTYILNTCHQKELFTALLDALVGLNVKVMAYDGPDIEHHNQHRLLQDLKPIKATKWSKEDILWK